MAAVCRRAVSIVARQTRRRAVGQAILTHVAEKTIFRDPRFERAVTVSEELKLKILLVVGVLLVLALVLYRVLRPAIAVARQFLKTIRYFQTISTPTERKRAVEKLVQCETCGVWIPEGRTLTSGSLAYCSRDCLKRTGVGRRKNSAA